MEDKMEHFSKKDMSIGLHFSGSLFHKSPKFYKEGKDNVLSNLTCARPIFLVELR